ncbi:flavin reductase family protein [Pseudomonas aeruginosa]|jgi:flavin reductase (DIM6/NTAB) family NADH-FMN oxidoreductase RutF|nr:flavin reductase family protein [Pseudomonas aeruginosa]MCS9139117.1 flavin reductase family protein [Pseudomonas aeruginosa]MCS9211902.1 flavin reductase family protein [Pseudomonas aeruginosa]
MLTEATVPFDFFSYDPATGHGLPHNPLQAIIAPRPIGWISSISSTGRNNLAPYSFFNMLRPDPPLLAFASGGEKDSLVNIRETGRFVWNLVTEQLAQQMNITSSAVAPEVDEFALAGLTPAPSSFDGPAYVAQSPVSFDCVATQIVELLDRNGQASGSYLVVGEVVHVRIARELLDDGIYVTERAGPIFRGGGPGDYFRLMPGGLFHMNRPT